MIDTFLANKLQKRLKLLLRVIYYYCTVSLALLYIYVYYGYVNGTYEINDEIKQNTVAFHKPQNISACSDNTFPTIKGCAPCNNGTFGFSGWSECKPLLNCSDIALQVHLKHRIFRGKVKEKWLADWNGHRVVYVNCSSTEVKTKCLSGMSRMEQLQGPFVIPLVGRCYEKLEVGFSRFITSYAGQIGYLWVKAVKNLISPITCYFEENTDEMSWNMNIYFTLNIILSFRDMMPRTYTDKYTCTFLIPFASCGQVLLLYL